MSGASDGLLPYVPHSVSSCFYAVSDDLHEVSTQRYCMPGYHHTMPTLDHAMSCRHNRMSRRADSVSSAVDRMPDRSDRVPGNLDLLPVDCVAMSAGHLQYEYPRRTSVGWCNSGKARERAIGNRPRIVCRSQLVAAENASPLRSMREA